MGDVVSLDPTADRRWDRFVAAHEFGWLCHLSGWKTVLERSCPHMRGHYLVLQDGNGADIKAALPCFEVRSWLKGTRLVSIPFATLCDPLVSSGSQFEQLFASAMDLRKQLNLSYIQIRTHKSSSLMPDRKLSTCGFYKQHYLMLTSDPEQLWKRFHRTCVRQRISRAIKSGLTLRVAQGESDLQDFYRLYAMTRGRLGLPPQPYVFFKSLWDVFHESGYVSVLLALQGGSAIAALLLFRFKDRVSAEHMACDPGSRSVSPNHFLFWEAIKAASQEGFKVFDFGRTSCSNHRLMDFKSRWATEVRDLPDWYYPSEASTKVAEPEKSLLYRLTRTACRNLPTSATLRIGNFCYKHLG